MTEDIKKESEKARAVPAVSDEVKTCAAKTPSWWDIAAVLLVFALSQGAAVAVCRLLGIEGADMNVARDGDEADFAAYVQGRYVAAVYFISMLVCLPILWYYKSLRGWNVRLSFRAPGWASPFRLLCGYALLWCMTIAAEPLASRLPGSQSMLGGGGWLLVSAVVLAPIFEETVFRGYIAGALRSAYGGVAAWIWSALIFGAVHIVPSVVVNAVLCGLVLGFYYLRYRSLVLVILLHAMNNVTACFLRTIGMDDTTVREVVGGGTAYTIIYAVCAAVCVMAVVRMFRLLRRVESDNCIASK